MEIVVKRPRLVERIQYIFNWSAANARNNTKLLNAPTYKRFKFHTRATSRPRPRPPPAARLAPLSTFVPEAHTCATRHLYHEQLRGGQRITFTFFLTLFFMLHLYWQLVWKCQSFLILCLTSCTIYFYAKYTIVI